MVQLSQVKKVIIDDSISITENVTMVWFNIAVNENKVIFNNSILACEYNIVFRFNIPVGMGCMIYDSIMLFDMVWLVSLIQLKFMKYIGINDSVCPFDDICNYGFNEIV